MKKFILILGLLPVFSTNARADICYNINEQVATKALEILQNQNEIYQYCSICPAAETKTISVNKIQNGNPIYVNDIALDLAHIYYKKDNKFINLGVASGCIKAGEYDIQAELKNLANPMNSTSKIKALKQDVVNCTNVFENEEKKCPELWNIKCYNHLMHTHKNTQQCYKKIAIDLFQNYYSLSKTDAETRFDTIQNVIHNQYLFIYNENDYCKKSNCGVSSNLYSEYATTQALYNYINKIITFIINQ